MLALLLLFTTLLTGCNSGERPDMDENLLVSGEIILQDEGPPFDRASIYVRLEDASRAGAPADIIAEQVFQQVQNSDLPLSFELHGELPDQQAYYIVSVHIDVDNDGLLSSGDYITTESYPVITHGAPQQVTIRVRRI